MNSHRQKGVAIILVLLIVALATSLAAFITTQQNLWQRQVESQLDRAQARRIGFSHMVSLGEHADVDFGDMLDYLASDPKTRAILLYIESIGDPRRFGHLAREVGHDKPIVAVKSGRSAAGARAAASHTGALLAVAASARR